jgi:hypothetical protein
MYVGLVREVNPRSAQHNPPGFGWLSNNLFHLLIGVAESMVFHGMTPRAIIGKSGWFSHLGHL